MEVEKEVLKTVKELEIKVIEKIKEVPVEKEIIKTVTEYKDRVVI